VCQTCALFARCVQSKTEGRTITSHYTCTHRQVRCHEALLQTARAQQATPEFKETYRKRSAVERKIADLVGHGLRRARYIGRVKVRLQNEWVGAVVNLKRLFRLFREDTARMRQVVSTMNTA